MPRIVRRRGYSVLKLLVILGAFTGWVLARPVRAQDPAAEMIAVINALRASYGLAPYAVDPGLMAMAQEHSRYQASIHKSTHQHSDGSDPPDLGVVENVAGGTLGYITPQIVVYKIWADAGHLHTMIGYEGGVMGVGVANDGETEYYTLEVRPTGTVSRPPAEGTPVRAATPLPVVPLATVTPREDGSIVHQVGYGQTLWAIALAYGVKIDQLRAWNNLDEGASEIYAGQWLLVRPANLAPATPTSQSGGQPGDVVMTTSEPVSESTVTPLTPTATPTIVMTTTASQVRAEAVAVKAASPDVDSTSPGVLLWIGGVCILVGGTLLVVVAVGRRK